MTLGLKPKYSEMPRPPRFYADDSGVSPLWHMFYSLLFESAYATIRRTVAHRDIGVNAGAPGSR